MCSARRSTSTHPPASRQPNEPLATSTAVPLDCRLNGAVPQQRRGARKEWLPSDRPLKGVDVLRAEGTDLAFHGYKIDLTTANGVHERRRAEP